MQRMVGQFESALATLQQLEAQYDNLAADAEAAERLRLERITGLEAEAEALRSARTVLQAELDGATADLGSRLADSERALAEARQQYQRAMIDASELTEEVGRLRSEVADARAVAHTAKQEAATAREEHAQASAALEREMASHMHTQGLLVSARAALEAARRDLAAQQEEAGCLREAAALLEAQCNDSTRALEAAHVKLAAADKRGDLLAQQVEQERGLHEQLLAGREAELETRWVRALQGAQDERARLSAALEAANRQLATAHHDMETMRLQIAHLRLVPLPPSAIDDHLLTRSNGVPSSLGCAPAGADGADDGGESQELQGDASIAETASQGSPDVFADLPDYPPPPTASTTGRLSIAAARGRGNHQRRQREQLTTHIDGLAERLSGYERSVAAACQAGSAATEQLAQSSRAVPEQLQQRQADVAAAAAAAEQRARRTKLAEEHEAYENEAAQLDKQLVEKQRAVAQQEAELQQLREVQAALQQQQQHERRQSEAAASPSAVAALQPADVLQEQQHQQLPLSTGGGYAPLHADQLAAENATLRRQLAAMRLASLGPSPTTTSSHGGAPSGRSLSGGGTGGRRQLQQPTAGSNSWRPSTGTTLKNGEAAAAAAPNAGLQLATSSGTLRFTREGDPLARARQQVQAAKAYLRQAAEWGGGRQGREHQ